MSIFHQKVGLFVVLILIAFMVGGYIMAATFFGVLTLIGMISLIESIPFLKWIVKRTTSLVDIVLFALTIAALSSYGFSIAGGLTVAGLGFTLVYAPYVRKEKQAKKKMKRVDNCKRM